MIQTTEKPLNTRQRLFIDYYEGNATKAAEKAGYSWKYANQACKWLLGNIRIKAEIEKKQAEVSRKIGISVEQQIEKTKELRDQAELSNHHTAALTANDQLNRHIGFYNADTSGGLSIVDIMAVVGINVQEADK